jgi:hypothetical protein
MYRLEFLWTPEKKPGDRASEHTLTHAFRAMHSSCLYRQRSVLWHAEYDQCVIRAMASRARWLRKLEATPNAVLMLTPKRVPPVGSCIAPAPSQFRAANSVPVRHNHIRPVITVYIVESLICAIMIMTTTQGGQRILPWVVAPSRPSQNAST